MHAPGASVPGVRIEPPVVREVGFIPHRALSSLSTPADRGRRKSCSRPVSRSFHQLPLSLSLSLSPPPTLFPRSPHTFSSRFSHLTPQWGAADAKIKIPSGENTELKRSPFKAWSRSVYRRTCYAYCQGFLPCLFLPFQSIHVHFFFFFFSKISPDFSCVGCGLHMVPV